MGNAPSCIAGSEPIKRKASAAASTGLALDNKKTAVDDGKLAVETWAPFEVVADSSKSLPVSQEDSVLELLSQRTGITTELLQLRHPNIVARQVFTTAKDYAVVMSHVEGAVPLKSLLLRQGPLPEKDARHIFCQLLDAIAHCHQQGIIYCGLNMSCLLIDPNTKQLQVRLDNIVTAKTRRHQPTGAAAVNEAAYMSPEMLLAGLPVCSARLCRASDVWTCGTLLYEMVTGMTPVRDPRTGRVLLPEASSLNEKRLPAMVTDNLSVTGQQLLLHMFQPSAKDRITVAEIQQHRWVFSSPRAATLAQQQSTPFSRSKSSPVEDTVDRLGNMGLAARSRSVMGEGALSLLSRSESTSSKDSIPPVSSTSRSVTGEDALALLGSSSSRGLRTSKSVHTSSSGDMSAARMALMAYASKGSMLQSYQPLSQLPKVDAALPTHPENSQRIAALRHHGRHGQAMRRKMMRQTSLMSTVH